MKTTFKQVFDEFDDELMNIDENSLTDVDIDVSKIKGDVFMRIKENNDSKKKFGKKFTVLLVAAIILLIGTIGVFASKSASGVFSGLFTPGSDLNALGLYDAKNISVTSNDDNLNVEVLGITGDSRKLYTVIEVTKKDGSEVIDSGYTHINKALNKDYAVFLTTKDGETQERFPSNSYEMSDDCKSLKIYTYIINGYQDCRLSYTCEEISAVKVDRVLGSLDLPKTQNEIEESSKDFWFSETEQEAMRNEYGLTEAECMYVERGGKREYCQASHQIFDVSFEISFDLNYEEQSFEKELNHQLAPRLLQPYAENVEMKVTPFGIYITAECDLSNTYRFNWMQCFKDDGFEVGNSTITMTDGTVYYLIAYPDSESENNNETGKCYELLSLYPTTTEGIEWMPSRSAIDINEIQTITIAGNTVYVKR